MERNFYNGDFEKFLRENADQYKMYPSDRVWKGVYKSLHTRYKWYRLSALLLLLAILTGSIVFITGSSPSSEKIVTTPANTEQIIRKSPVSAAESLQDNDNNVIAPNNSASGGKKRTPEKSALKADAVDYLQNLTRLTEIPDAITSHLFNSPEIMSFRETAGADKLLFKDAAPAERIYNESNELNAEIAENTMTDFAVIENIPGIRLRGKEKWEWQFHFTPTIGYRKLSENKSYLRSPAAQNSSLGYTAFLDVNNVVDHKPDMGLETGLDAKIPISHRLKAKTGLQLNVTRYGIRAYSYRAELATIALNSGYGFDSLNAISNFRNFNGYSSNWLENLYVQIAIPIGAEYILAENDKVKFGISGSFQPTYLLGKSAYLISGDYKNYVRVPHLVRRWNMNADVETFVSYSTGKIRWQVGPQARYQLLSSFVNEYPVKENLFNFGLKVGMSLNNK